MVFDELCYSHLLAVIRVRGLYMADTQRSRGREGGRKHGGRRRIECLQESEPGTRNKTSLKKKIPSPPRSSQPGGEESFELSYENYSVRQHMAGVQVICNQVRETHSGQLLSTDRRASGEQGPPAGGSRRLSEEAAPGHTRPG